MSFNFFRISRRLVLGADLALCGLSLVLAYLLRLNFDLQHEVWQYFGFAFPIVLLTKYVCFLYFKTYAGILKYSGIDDLKKLFIAMSLSSFVILVMQLVNNKIFGNQNFVPISVILIDYVASLAMVYAFRIVVRVWYFERQQTDRQRVNVVIFGAGASGMVTHKTLTDDASVFYKIAAFLDDDPKKAGDYLNGVPIFATTQLLKEQISTFNADLLVLAIQHLPTRRKKQIVDACLALGIQVLVVPPMYKWINGELSFRQIKEVQIEDILGREAIQLDPAAVDKELSNKVVLITGAAGSIGSELTRQIIKFKPKKLVLVDQAESALYDLELELTELYIKVNFEAVLGDIRNEERMEGLFQAFKPEVVFHAAAYKHVPVMEENPTESLETNILGTKILADLSVKYQVQKFVLLSTDKAVNPTSVMGASKRISEIYAQSLDAYLQDAGNAHTRFITTRFGNVLGSTGSVIPRFKKQIAEGGPVTVTHPDISRYFMTIQEACQLVLDAAAMGKGGEIYLFDMGHSIKIVDLAKKMIKLSGLTLGKDIQLVFTGLRPGEKLEEELFHEGENVKPTHHPKIRIADVKPNDYQQVKQRIEELLTLLPARNNDPIIVKMKQIVPEYISKNSIYEKFNTQA